MKGAQGPADESRRQGPGQDVRPLPPDLRGNPLDVGVEELREFLPSCFGLRGPEVAEHLDPAAAPFLVVPEVQIGPTADLFRRETTTELHGPGNDLTLLKVNRAAGQWVTWVAPTPRFPLETLLGPRGVPTDVGRPPGLPHPQRRGDH